VKPLDTYAAVERLEAELSASKARTADLEEQVFSHIAANLAGKGDAALFLPPMKGDSLRRLADTVAKESGGLAAVFAGEDNQYAYSLLRSDGADITPLVKSLNGALNGRGGGRNGFAQGSVQAKQGTIEKWLKENTSCSIT
jgi:alanyl-tRNA synthetase